MTEEKVQSIRNEMELTKQFNFLKPGDHEYKIMEIVSSVLKDVKCDNEILGENK